MFNRQGRIVKILGEQGLYRFPEFSPDGRKLLVLKTDLPKPGRDIWIFDLARGSAEQITFGAGPKTSPVWSPDGKEIAYVSVSEGVPAIYRKEATASAPERLIYRHIDSSRITLADWLSDDSIGFFSLSGIFWILPPNGGPLREIYGGAGFSARRTPNGRFIASSHSYVEGGIEIQGPIDPEKGPREPQSGLLSSQASMGSMFWRADGEEFYYRATDRGMMAVEVTTQQREFRAQKPRLLFRLPSTVSVFENQGDLAAVSGDGQRFVIAVPLVGPVLRRIEVTDLTGRTIKILGDPGSYGTPVFSPDGTKLAVERTDPSSGERDVWVYDITTARGIQLTSGPRREKNPVWSPDGRYVAYEASSDDAGAVYRKRSDGQGAEELLYRNKRGDVVLLLTDWSADGRFLSFFAGGVVYAVPLDRVNAKAIEIVREEYEASTPRFSPDSRSLAYLLNESRKNQIFVRILPTAGLNTEAEPRRITTEAVSDFGWREDGKAFYCVTPDGTVLEVEVTNTGTGPPQRLFERASDSQGFSYGHQRFAFQVIARN
jgi:Tol biopolymer transport system component